MTVRLLLVVALVVNVLVLATCTGQTSQAAASSGSSASAKSSSSSSYASSSSSADSVVKSKPKKCRKIKKCPKNEEFSYCPQSIQRAQYCSEKAEPALYRSQSDKPCKEGCVCKENYLRADNGTCIPSEQCPLTCGANEVLVNCPTSCESDYCPRTEEDTFAKPCLPHPVCPPPVCTCAFNYHRAANGTCIPTRKCPPFDCSHKSNEEYNPCPPLCPTDDCSQASPTGVCPRQFGRIGIVLRCNPRCRCIEGYWRREGICVPYGECPGVCPDNERYSTCVQAECRALNCTQKDQSVPCIRLDPKYCKKGCVCQEGYLKNQDGICVLEDKCEPTCPANEEHVACMQGVCRAKNCSERGQDVPCPDIPTEQCDSGCICKEGFLRAANGSCVPEDQCEGPLTCGTNEVVDNCPSSCGSDYCPRTEEDTFIKPCVAQLKCPPPVCTCAFNHHRAANGTCIPTTECPPFDCSHKPNEKYYACPPICPSDDCSQASPTGDCPPQFGIIGIVLPCNPTCRCIEGYWKRDGICVPYGECPGVCPDNERYSTCVQAECRALNCTQKDQSVPCIRLDPKYCEKGCVCQEGYLRNLNGICVLEDKCEPTCPANEEHVPCMQGVCRAKDCSERGQDVPCPDIPTEQCDSGCICKESFLRAANGSCVPEDQCEACGENEVLNDCPMMCNTDNCPLSADEEQVCTQVDPCVPGCKCKLNYRYAANGTCILTRDCPPFDCSAKPNEEFVACPPYCPTDECGKPRLDGHCPFRIGVLLQCNPKCQCKAGYGRVDGICVPFEECPNLCPTNEVYSPCVQQTCRPQNCSDRDLAMETCPTCNAAECQRGCVCQEDYYRNDKGDCISYEECGAHVCPANEEWSTCAQATCRAQNCTQRGKPIPCPMIVDGVCEKACVCKEGYLRNEAGNCIPEDQCPCGENEVLNDCPMMCNTDNCPLSADEEQVCTQVDPCVPGCKCKLNYRYAANGTCIPTRDCPPFDCSAKPNEEFVACPPYCPTDECGKPRLDGHCPFRIGVLLQCNPKCQCKAGYGRVDGICVPFEECPNLCPTNEVYSPCVQQTCRPQNCSDRDLAMETCPTCNAAECQRGCVCQEDYYRNDKGDCISYEECGAHVCPANEEWSTCAQATCRAQNCTQRGKPIACPMIVDGFCEKACVCKEGYLRNEAGKCIPEDQCPCGENEVLNDCPMMCNTDNCPLSADEEQVCTQADPCVPGCKCKLNYRHAANGTCIPTRDCPPFDCSAKPNEEFVACPPYCPTDECGKPRLDGHCPFRIGVLLQCNPKCQCKDGYGRFDGICVPFEECPNLCPTNEVYSPCVQQTCRPQNCSDRDLAMETCPTCNAAECQRGCVCQEDYYRNDKGDCISYEECGAHVCPANEEWSTCAQATCRAQNCTQRGKPIACPMIVDGFCEKACVCKEGYLRNEAGKCIPEDQCPCGENEVLNDCPMMCNTDNCPLSADEEQVCTQVDPCVPGCKCKLNYRYAANGTCIPTRDCPPFDCSAKPNEEFVACPPYCPTDECGKPRLDGHCPFRIGVLLQCNPKCQCKAGYGRVDGICVPFEECPNLCPTNEVYSPCVQQTCRPQNCSDRDLAMETCPTCNAAECQRGCVCQEDYYRNDKGDCISYEECGVPMCPNAHEVYEPNFMECPPNICDSLVARYRCDPKQKVGPGCRCKDGYLKLNQTEPCVPICDCPQMESSADCPK